MGRDKLYPEEWNLDLRSNAEDLIRRVNNLLIALKIDDCKVTSGWRPSAINSRAQGAKRSLHMTCRAVDLADSNQSLTKGILQEPQLLLEYGLWLESPDVTHGWVHLDTGVRSERLIRVFKP